MIEWVVFALVTSIKLLLIPAYRSTDFEVHRNWLAITHSLPLREWYYENTSEWTLDYPPFFAYFEWTLSQAAVFFDPNMLIVSNLNYASPQTVLFQRLTVIVSDLLLLFAIQHFCKVTLKNYPEWNKLTVYIITLLNAGLLIVDHIHFQYNGFLFGILVLSISCISSGHEIVGALLFAALLNFKHIFLYISPMFAIYLLSAYCFKNGSFSILRFLTLGVCVVFVFSLSLGPFVAMGQIQQLLSRLFPFKRGLVHAYWAPNAWAIYLFVDRALRFVLMKYTGANFDHGPSVTSGLVGVGSASVLPNVSPLATLLTTVIAMAPGIVWLWRRPQWHNFILSVVYAALCSFMFGWHVHEKAILLAIIPLGLISFVDKTYVRWYLILSTVGHFSLFPLLFRPTETMVKISILLIHSLLAYFMLSSGQQRGDKSLLGKIDMLLILGLIPLQLFYSLSQFIPVVSQPQFEFLPLMAISVYCAIVVSIVWLRMLYYMITSISIKGPHQKIH